MIAKQFILGMLSGVKYQGLPETFAREGQHLTKCMRRPSLRSFVAEETVQNIKINFKRNKQ